MDELWIVSGVVGVSSLHCLIPFQPPPPPTFHGQPVAGVGPHKEEENDGWLRLRPIIPGWDSDEDQPADQSAQLKVGSRNSSVGKVGWTEDGVMVRRCLVDYYYSSCLLQRKKDLPDTWETERFVRMSVAVFPLSMYMYVVIGFHTATASLLSAWKLVWLTAHMSITWCTDVIVEVFEMMLVHRYAKHFFDVLVSRTMFIYVEEWTSLNFVVG